MRVSASLICICLAATLVEAQTVWHVDDDNCSGPGSGIETDPFCLIQGCIDAAMDSDEIVVAPGTYFENIDLLGKAVNLHGSAVLAKSGCGVDQVDPATLTCTGLIDFEDVAGGDPGTNFDGVLVSGLGSFAESFAGMTVSFVGDFDVLSGTPTSPLTLQVGSPNENVAVLSFRGDNVLAGLGPTGFPNNNSIGEGSFAALFNSAQFELGFTIVGADGGSATVNFFAADGSLIDTMVLAKIGDQTFAFRRAWNVRDIAGISIHNDDDGGIGFDDFIICDDSDGRVTICHIPPGNPGNARTILVSMRALPAHLAHGDYCGPCEDSAQTVWYVDDDGDPANGCTSWADACPELQTALSLAADGDQIWVAEGTYRPDYDVKAGQHAGNREASFQLISGVGLYGGFDGTEESLEDRAGLFDETVLSGDLDGNDGPEFKNNDENSLHIVMSIAVSSTTVLDGFTIEGGNANLGNINGGGFYNDGGHPAIAHCTFLKNRAQADGGAFVSNVGDVTLAHCSFIGNEATIDGAVQIYGSGTASFTYCDFVDNHALFIGAVDCQTSAVFDHCNFILNTAQAFGVLTLTNGEYYIANCDFIGNTSDSRILSLLSATTATLTDCSFRDNTLLGYGGAVSTHGNIVITGCEFSANVGGGVSINSGAAVLENCVFNGNIASSGGAIKATSPATALSLIDCSFVQNQASQWGGAAFIWGVDATLRNCTFERNSAGDDGGALSFLGSINPTTRACDFIQNTAGGNGGAISRAQGVLAACRFLGNSAAGNGGGSDCFNADPTFVNCLFAGNSANNLGGGMYNINGSPTVSNCTLSRNTAEVGSGMYNTGGVAVITNSIMWGNSDTQLSGVATVSYSVIEGGWSGAGNIDADPLFVLNPDPGPDGEWGTEDDDYGDLRLLPGSPCIDAADNSAVPADTSDLDGDGDTSEPIPLDLDDNLRFVDDPNTEDTGMPDPKYPKLPFVDMGAFEFQTGCVDDPDCEDDNACTIDECIDALCVNKPIDCDDGNECIDDSCDFDTGCTHEDTKCPKGQVCDPETGECVVDQDPCECVNGRVTLCHIPQGNRANAHTINVACAARGKHLAHGDFCGPCEDGNG